MYVGPGPLFLIQEGHITMDPKTTKTHFQQTLAVAGKNGPYVKYWKIFFYNYNQTIRLCNSYIFTICIFQEYTNP